ncbi:MAG: polysaccharide deacetylase family protein [Bryobacteraceae bacterium]
MPLSQILDTPGSIAITFDDGFANFQDQALPALERYGLPATVFVVTGHCGGYNNWTQPMQGLPELPLLSWEQIRELPQPLVQFGGHTITHADLTKLPITLVENELREARKELEDRTGQNIGTFAYPFGATNVPVRQLASSHYAIGCSTELRSIGGSSDPMDLPRVDAYYLQDQSHFEAFVRGGADAYLGLRRLLRRIRAVVAR